MISYTNKNLNKVILFIFNEQKNTPATYLNPWNQQNLKWLA